MPGSFSSPIWNQTWVVTGGAGYLGRALALSLRARGVRVATIDNLSTSKRPEGDTDFYEVDLRNWEASKAVWERLQKEIPGPIGGVFHFAAKALVGESHQMPDLYLENNVGAARTVARLCALLPKPPSLVHSSSCAIYGAPEKLPLTEESPQNPLSPYGHSKKQAEELLTSMAVEVGLRVLNLRYFNPVGALADGSHGELHEPETHLIPNAVLAAIRGSELEIYGSDYPTPDGTCLRDYFHLDDLVTAHIAGARYLATAKACTSESINIGSGTAVSVSQAVKLVEEVVGQPISKKLRSARPGDPAHLTACITKAKRVLGWEPQKNLRQAIDSHYRFISTRFRLR